MLGWTESSWDGTDSPPPPSENSAFDELTFEQQGAAMYGLGYDAASWNEEEGDQQEKGDQQQQGPPPSFVPENDVERALMAAAKANGKGGTTKAFHAALMKAERVYFISADDGEVKNDSFSLGVQAHMLGGKPCFPLFTSPLRLQEFARGAPEGEKIRPFDLPPRVFLQVTKGMLPPELPLPYPARPPRR